MGEAGCTATTPPAPPPTEPGTARHRAGASQAAGLGGHGDDSLCTPSPQRKTLAGLRTRWRTALYRELQETKESEAHAAREGRLSLFPYLCLLSEKEVVRMLLQVRTGPGGGAAAGVPAASTRSAGLMALAALQTLQALPAQGESLLFLARELGLRVFKRKQLRNEVQELEQRYSKYLHLLASDTQVRPREPGWGNPGVERRSPPLSPLPFPEAAGFAPRLHLIFLT